MRNLDLDPPALTICKPDYYAYKNEVLKERYGIHLGMERTLEVREYYEREGWGSTPSGGFIES